MPVTFGALVEASRSIRSPETFHAFISEHRATLPGAVHPHKGLLIAKGIQSFQNWLLDENAQWRLTDAQLLALMLLEFPQAHGLIFTGDLPTGLKQLAGIRAHYNRDGHNGPSPTSRGIPLSVSYGLWSPDATLKTNRSAARQRVRITRVGALLTSPNDHRYVECETDSGVIACWGSKADSTNIELLRSEVAPFDIESLTIPSNWSQHRLWIPQLHDGKPNRITVLRTAMSNISRETSPVSDDSVVTTSDLAAWRSAIVALLRTLEASQGHRATADQGVGTRLGQLSRANLIPREIAALMRTVTEMRNSAEYDGKALSVAESAAVRHSWTAITEWATKSGLAMRTSK